MPKMQMPDFQAHLSKHPHNTSAGYTSTLAPGLLQTQYFDILQPGETVYYQTNAFARLQDVVTAFLGEVEINVDYFFVPLQMMYTPFGQIYAQTDDFISSIFTRDEDRIRKDYFPQLNLMDCITSTPFETIPDFAFECWGKNSMRFLDMMDLNPYSGLYTTDPEGTITDFIDYAGSPKISPWIVCAYQAIYQKYFRNDDLERLDVSSYNFDYYYAAQDLIGQKYLQVRSVQRKKDYFTSMRPSPMFSAVNKIGSTVADETNGFGSPTTGNQNLLAKVNNFLGYNNMNVGDGEETTNPHMFNGKTVSDNAFFGSASSIRALFAVDKFLRIYGRAGKTYDDQILAHFGYKIPHDVKHDLTHLKHYRFSITTDPVYSTSTIGNENGSVLGQVGGQGSNSIKTGREKFTAPVHGVIMAVAYAQTRPRYQGTFSKLHLLNTRIDFPIAEFDKLGMQPMYGFEAEPLYFKFSDPAGSSQPYINKRIGWQRRYAQFKEKYNRISLGFSNIKPDNTSIGVNVYNPWVLSRKPFDTDSDLVETSGKEYLDAGYFFEPANALDNVMVTKFAYEWSDEFYNNPWLAFQSDPIIFEFYANVKKLSWMSPEGEPDL